MTHFTIVTHFFLNDSLWLTCISFHLFFSKQPREILVTTERKIHEKISSKEDFLHKSNYNMISEIKKFVLIMQRLGYFQLVPRLQYNFIKYYFFPNRETSI